MKKSIKYQDTSSKIEEMKLKNWEVENGYVENDRVDY